MKTTLNIILNLTSSNKNLTEREIDILTDCIEILEIKGLNKCYLEMLKEAWPSPDELNFKAWLVSTTLDNRRSA